MVGVACIFPIDDDADIPGAATDGADTDQREERGWLFDCHNMGNDPNWWWSFHTGMCLTDPPSPSCWFKNYSVLLEQQVPVEVCINATNVAGFDPSNWTAFENGIRTECSKRCEDRNGENGAGEPPPTDPKCDVADWSAVNYYQAGNPDPLGSDCNLPDYVGLELDPDGSSIVWPGGGSAPTHCNLYDGECDGDFDAIVFPWVSHLYLDEDIDMSSRRADRLAVSTTSKVTFYASTGTFVLPLDATVEYSTASCTSAGCPFYLANMEAAQTGGPLTVSIPHEGGVLQKKLSEFEIDLVHSAFGIENQSTDDFALTEGTLRLQVKFTLVNTDGNATGDGTFTKLLVNDDLIFGDKTATGVTSFVVQREFIPNVTAVIELDQADDVEVEPSVSDTLPSSLRCDSVSTEVSLAPYISASDPDGDLDIKGWLIDHEGLHDHDVGLGNGTYDIFAVAIDTRGAVAVGPTKQVTVSGCP